MSMKEEMARKHQEELRLKEAAAREVLAELEKLLAKAEEEAQRAQKGLEGLCECHLEPPKGLGEGLEECFPSRAPEALRLSKSTKSLGLKAQQACEAAWKYLEQHRMKLFQVQ